jgi:transposase-like protein
MNIETLQYEQDTDPAYCPACDSADAQILGQLGNRIHLRCRGCGIDFNFEAPRFEPWGEHDVPND